MGVVLNNFLESFCVQGAVGTQIRGNNGYGVRLDGMKVNNYARFELYGFSTTITNTNGYATIVVGSNSTPVEPSDYAWNNDITTLTKVSQNCIIADRDGRKVLRFLLQTTNDTSDDVEVSEVGVIICINGGNNVLIAREVLDTPITVKANGGAQVFGIDIG